jgi:GMP synthase (glutamine-hydrolysing)
MKPILIVKTGGTYPDMAARFGDFEDWFLQRLDRASVPIDTVCPPAGEKLPPIATLGGVIITGSHDMVTERLPWSESAALWVKEAVNRQIPVLGVCYGHQLLAHALGGVVGDNPNGKEIGTVAVRISGRARADRLFEGLPEIFDAQASHTQSVLQLPAGATLLASSEMDPHHAFSVGKCAWGVQFHPEFNVEVMRNYIQRFADDLAAQGSDVNDLLERVRETPISDGLLLRFQQLCR